MAGSDLPRVANWWQKWAMTLKFIPRHEFDDPPLGRSPFIMKSLQPPEEKQRVDDGVSADDITHSEKGAGEADASAVVQLLPRDERPADLQTTDPLIQGLVARLPNPDSAWSLEDRMKWLRAAANIFVLIHKLDDGEDRELQIAFAKVGPRTVAS
jgi:hypothetical protein